MDDEPNPVHTTSIVHSKEGLGVTITDADGIAGRFNRELVRAGKQADLREADLKILNAMKSEIKAHNLTTLGEPFVVMSQPEIMEATGLGLASVQRRPKAMAALGILTIHAHGLGPTRSIYILHFATQSRMPRKNDATELICQELRGVDPILRMGSLFGSDKGESPTGVGDQGARTEGTMARACAPPSPTHGGDQGARPQGVTLSERAPLSPTTVGDPTGARLSPIPPEGIKARARAPLSPTGVGDSPPAPYVGFTTTTLTTTTAVVEDEAVKRELLLREFDEQTIARLVEHPNCTVEQIGIAIQRADRDGPRYLARGGDFNRGGYIIRAIEQRWKLPRERTEPGQGQPMRREDRMRKLIQAHQAQKEHPL